jgi:hypothetical protein
MSLARCLAAIAAAAAILPASAAGHSLVRSSGTVVSYTSADATSLNTLTVRAGGGRVEFRDPTVDGGMDPGPCEPGELGPQSWIIQTFCSLGGVQRVRIDLGEREDSAIVTLPVPTTLLGGPGADRIAAGDAGNELDGGEGNDAVTGGAGDDALSGGPGVDQLSGAEGADRLVSRDGAPDDVRCGDGDDAVDADTFDEVAPDCESVSRTTTAPTDAGADDGLPPELDVGAPTLQRVGRSRRVRAYATSSERGTISASGALEIAGLAVPVKTGRQRVEVAGGGVVLSYRLRAGRWRAVRRALRLGRPVAVRLGVVATDLAGRSRRRNAPRIRLAGGGEAAAVLAAHPEPGDIDGDEVPDAVDNCPTVKNGSQLNTDRDLPGGDELGDACDDDDDADGVPDTTDNCRVVANPGQEDTDGDGHGDACPPVDRDGDGLIDEDDNCDLVVNPDQSDLDGDDKGDLCDRDDDGDKYDDEYDNCPTVWNFDQADGDGDGIGTVCDPEEGAVTASPDADRSAPRLEVGVRRRHRLSAVRAGLVVRLRCSEACGATAELALSPSTARRLGLGRSLIVAGGSARLAGAGITYAFVRFDRRARRALFRQRRLRLTLTTRAVDESGNRTTSSRRVDLHR